MQIASANCNDIDALRGVDLLTLRLDSMNLKFLKFAHPVKFLQLKDKLSVLLLKWSNLLKSQKSVSHVPMLNPAKRLA